MILVAYMWEVLTPFSKVCRHELLQIQELKSVLQHQPRRLRKWFGYPIEALTGVAEEMRLISKKPIVN